MRNGKHVVVKMEKRLKTKIYKLNIRHFLYRNDKYIEYERIDNNPFVHVKNDLINESKVE